MSMMNNPSPPDPVMVLSASDPLTSLTFDDQDILFTGHQNGQIREWSTHTQRTKFSWSGHSDSVISLVYTEAFLISHGREGQIKFWIKKDDQTSWKNCNQITCATLIFCNIIHLQFNDSSYLAVPCDETAKIKIFQLSMDAATSGSFPEISTLEPTSVKDFGMCMNMCTPSKITQKLLVGYESGTIALWDGEKGACLAQARLHEESVMCLDCVLDTDLETIIGVSASADKSIHKWKVTNGEVLRYQTVHATNAGFCDIKIRQDGRIFVTGGWDSMGRIFTLKKLKPLAVLSYHKQSVQCVEFTGDKTIVTGSKDGYIAFWNVYKNT